MPVEKITPVLNVTDIGQSFSWFEAMGWKRTFSWNESGLIGQGGEAAIENDAGPADFAGVCIGDVTLFLCRDGQGPKDVPNGQEEATGVWMSWWVSNKSEVDAMYELAVANGFSTPQPPADEPWGVREFHLRHPDGHTFRVSCGIDS